MKKVLFLFSLCIVIIAVSFTGCSKDIVARTDNAPSLMPASADLDAGTWKPILITAPDEFAVVPAAVTTPDYSPGE
ncbi:MAG: hypothetical protein WKI04_09505 [Ferruginibacter sp.]